MEGTFRPVVLAAPSGAGKTTIARVLVEQEEDFAFSVSATTRAPREQEVHGRDYWFLPESRFRAMIRGGEFVEWAEVHGHLYGTPVASLLRAREAGRHLVLDIDVQGAMQIREAVPEALLLFILPPSADTLLRRLKARGTEGTADLRRRLNTAVRELEAAEAFDFFIVNDDLRRAVEEVRDLVRKSGSPAAVPSGSLKHLRSLRAGIQSLLEDSTFFNDQEEDHT